MIVYQAVCHTCGFNIQDKNITELKRKLEDRGGELWLDRDGICTKMECPNGHDSMQAFQEENE